MSIVLTGGAGFIGSNLLDHLLATTTKQLLVIDNLSTGSADQVPNNDRIQLIKTDIKHANQISPHIESADFVYHLAAAVGVQHVTDNPLEALETNLIGTENVLKATAEHDVPLFLASSSEIYGKNESVPFSETDNRVLGPTTVSRWGYASAKAVDEALALAYHDEMDLQVIIGRYFNIVGPGQSGQYGMVIPRFVDQALNEDPITVYGDGTQTRSFTHVEEAVKITHDLTQREDAYGEVFNIGSPQPTSINTLAERVIELTDSNSEITRIPHEEAFGPDFEEPQKREPDVAKLESTVGWKPSTDIDSILSDVIEERRKLSTRN